MSDQNAGVAAYQSGKRSTPAPNPNNSAPQGPSTSVPNIVPGAGSGHIFDQPAPSASNPQPFTVAPGVVYAYNPKSQRWELQGPAPIGVDPSYVAQLPMRSPFGASGGGTERSAEYSTSNPNATTVTPQYGVNIVPPRYTAGDDQVILRGITTQRLIEIQEMFVDMGLIGTSTNISYGNVDNPTQAAMNVILANANSAGTTWQEELQRAYTATITATKGGYLDENGQPVEQSTGSSLKSGYLTNADDLKAIAQQTAVRVLGHRVDNTFLDSFVSNFHAMESAFHQSQQPGTPAQPEQVAQPNVAAEKAFREGDYGNEAEAHDMANMFDTFRKVIAGPFGAG